MGGDPNGTPTYARLESVAPGDDPDACAFHSTVPGPDGPEVDRYVCSAEVSTGRALLVGMVTRDLMGDADLDALAAVIATGRQFNVDPLDLGISTRLPTGVRVRGAQCRGMFNAPEPGRHYAKCVAEDRAERLHVQINHLNPFPQVAFPQPLAEDVNRLVRFLLDSEG